MIDNLRRPVFQHINFTTRLRQVPCLKFRHGLFDSELTFFSLSVHFFVETGNQLFRYFRRWLSWLPRVCHVARSPEDVPRYLVCSLGGHGCDSDPWSLVSPLSGHGDLYGISVNECRMNGNAGLGRAVGPRERFKLVFLTSLTCCDLLVCFKLWARFSCRRLFASPSIGL